MLSVYMTEWMKLKRSALLWIGLIIYIYPIIIPHRVSLFWLFGEGFYFFPFIATAFIFSREYQENTISQLFTYPQSRQQVYFGKMCLIMTIFLLNLFFLYIRGSVTVGNVHATMVFINLVPLLILAGILFRNVLLSVAVQMGLGWFIEGQVQRMQNKYNYISTYASDIRLPLHDFGLVKIRNIFMEYLWATPNNITFTILVLSLSIVSTGVGVYLFTKKDINSN